MYTKENQRLKFQFILARDKKRPVSSVLYYQARKKGLWVALESWN